jgi:1,4-dihydroxy-2-naphthoate octaprenyltransferase
MKRWLLAIRPKTLGISIVPVLVGTSLAWRETGLFSLLPMLAALCGALLIQIGTNLHNDAADFERGTDNKDRLGPPRAAAQGWFSPGEIKRAAALAFGLAFLTGIYLAWIGGWPIIILGLFSLLAGYAYTGGPKPIAYSASGELFVFLFFGLMAVMGSYYLQTLSLTANALFSAAAVGLLAAAVLLVNNYRDLDNDRKAQKLTLTHYLGRQGSHLLYGLLLLLPFLLPLLLEEIGNWPWLVLFSLPVALLLIFRFATQPVGPAFNLLLAATARLQLIYGLLFVGALLVR